MGYIIGICGIVLAAAVVFAILYTFFVKRYDLDDVALNSREDRRYGNVELDYDYDDDDRVEAFQDMVDFAKKVEDEEFDATVEEINKFVARRSENNAPVEDFEELQVQPIQTSVPQQVPVQQVQAQSVVQQPVQTAPQQVQVVQQMIPQVQQTVQQPVIQSAQASPTVTPQVMRQDNLYEQINNDDFDDYIEEL